LPEGNVENHLVPDPGSKRLGRLTARELRPKTARSRRTIPLPPMVTRALVEHRKREDEEWRPAVGEALDRLDRLFEEGQK